MKRTMRSETWTPRKFPRGCYFVILILPLITLVLLQVDEWRENHSECNPEQKRLVIITHNERQSDTDNVVQPMGKLVYAPIICTCIPEFPAYTYILLCFEVLASLYFFASEPFKNPPFDTIAEFCTGCNISTRLLCILLFDISYVSLVALNMSAMGQSNQYCGLALVTWCTGALFFRACIIIAFHWPWDKTSENVPNDNPSESLYGPLPPRDDTESTPRV